MLDLRKHEQKYMGFYVWKNTQKKYWSVGKNGTSIHTTIPFNPSAKEEILSFIHSHSISF